MSTNFNVRIVVRLMQELSLQVKPLVRAALRKVVSEFAGSFECLRSKEGADRTVKIIAAGFGDDLHDAAGGLAILRFESAGLHLNFFHKAQVDAGRQRSVQTR